MKNITPNDLFDLYINSDLSSFVQAMRKRCPPLRYILLLKHKEIITLSEKKLGLAETGEYKIFRRNFSSKYGSEYMRYYFNIEYSVHISLLNGLKLSTEMMNEYNFHQNDLLFAVIGGNKEVINIINESLSNIKDKEVTKLTYYFFAKCALYGRYDLLEEAINNTEKDLVLEDITLLSCNVESYARFLYYAIPLDSIRGVGRENFIRFSKEKGVSYLGNKFPPCNIVESREGMERVVELIGNEPESCFKYVSMIVHSFGRLRRFDFDSFIEDSYAIKPLLDAILNCYKQWKASPPLCIEKEREISITICKCVDMLSQYVKQNCYFTVEAILDFMIEFNEVFNNPYVSEVINRISRTSMESLDIKRLLIEKRQYLDAIQRQAKLVQDSLLNRN